MPPKEKAPRVMQMRPGLNKFLNHTLYAYTQQVNGAYVRSQAEKHGVSYSVYVDAMIEARRTKKHLSVVLSRYKRVD